MSWPRPKNVSVVLLLMAGVLVCAWIAARLWSPAEPIYEGKPVSAWLKEMESWNGDTNEAVFVAFSRMDTNVIPFLVGKIRAPRSEFQRLVHKANRAQGVVQIPEGDMGSGLAAAYGLYAMGKNATPAAPVLTDMLFRTNALDVASASRSALALAGMTEGIHALIVASTNENRFTREWAVSALGFARSDFDDVLPALFDRLNDGYRSVKGGAAAALGQLHQKPRMVVPALMKAFDQADTHTQLAIIVSLAKFGPDAKESVPMLLEALKRADPTLEDSLRFALKEIDPKAAAKAGIK